jgi:hypothetical protein
VNKKKKIKEPVSELFVKLFVNVGARYANSEYVSEMLNVGVTERQLPRAAFEFAMDNMPHEFNRLTQVEQKEVEKQLLKYFKGVLT